MSRTIPDPEIVSSIWGIISHVWEKGKALKSVEDTKIEKVSKKVTFPVWFHYQVKLGNLKFWQEKEVSVFFKQKGLSESEEADKYSELLKLY